MKKVNRGSFLVKWVSHLLIVFTFFGYFPSTWAQALATTESGIQNVQEGFSDIPRSHPYYVAITYLKKEGVFNGYDDGTFKSEGVINKAEVAKILMTSIKAPLDVPFEPIFSDMTADLWYSPHVMKAHSLGFVTGNDGLGTFTGAKQVNLAEFLKMLIAANQIDVSDLEGKVVAPNIDPSLWFANYVNYALALGILPANADGSVDPAKLLTRGEVANMMYLLSVVRNGSDTEFLLTRAETELAQIEVYIAANQMALSKNASELAVDFTQQALKNMPEDKVVLGAAKIARAYDWLVDAYILGIQGKKEEAAQKANEVIDKATEAWQANPDTQPIAAHIKERAREILSQVGGVEV